MKAAALIALSVADAGIARFPVGESWDIQLSPPLAPARAVDVLDLDPDEATAEQIAALRARGVKPVCYVSVGTVEAWRDDAADFPADLVGRVYDGWPDERFLDIRRVDALLTLMRPRFARCRALGFLAIEADNIDLHHNDSGFDIGAQDVAAYVRALAALAHGMGVALGQKNAPDLVSALVADLDFMVSESCFQDGWCAQAQPYLAAGKAVFAIEYDDRPLDLRAACADARGQGRSMVVKDRDLHAPRRGCDAQ